LAVTTRTQDKLDDMVADIRATLASTEQPLAQKDEEMAQNQQRREEEIAKNRQRHEEQMADNHRCHEAQMAEDFLDVSLIFERMVLEKPQEIVVILLNLNIFDEKHHHFFN
jgi:hypothetical protein